MGRWAREAAEEERAREAEVGEPTYGQSGTLPCLALLPVPAAEVRPNRRDQRDFVEDTAASVSGQKCQKS